MISNILKILLLAHNTIRLVNNHDCPWRFRGHHNPAGQIASAWSSCPWGLPPGDSCGWLLALDVVNFRHFLNAILHNKHNPSLD